jgi:large subunit ribosomal protein L10
MSKQIKQLEMDALKKTFHDVRDMVLLSVSGVNAQADNQIRRGLRKKNIRLQVVKNSLVRRVFGEMGMPMDGCWEGPTLIAWGAGGLAELSRELDGLIKKNDKIKVKTAVSEGQLLPFDKAKTMPTREEAIATILGMILGPAAQIAGQIIGPAAQIAGQIKTLSEKKPEEAAAPPAG